MCHKQDIMEVVRTTYKGGHPDTLEKYYIYCETTRGIQINYEITVSRNSIFDAVVHSSQYVTCNGLNVVVCRMCDMQDRCDRPELRV